jgi:hypothetical protein
VIPDFNENGDLPVGIHATTLREVLARFGKDAPQRHLVAQRLERIYQLAQQTGRLARLIVFGSFITNKLEPNDVDVVIIMDDEFVADPFSGDTRLLFDHAVSQAHFGASIFWVRQFAALGDPKTFVEDWQIKRDGTRRGIIEIIPEAT